MHVLNCVRVGITEYKQHVVCLVYQPPKVELRKKVELMRLCVLKKRGAKVVAVVIVRQIVLYHVPACLKYGRARGQKKWFGTLGAVDVDHVSFFNTLAVIKRKIYKHVGIAL